MSSTFIAFQLNSYDKFSIDSYEIVLWVISFLVIYGAVYLIALLKHQLKIIDVWNGSMHCNNCGYSWESRRDTPPSTCPNCRNKSIYPHTSSSSKIDVCKLFTEIMFVRRVTDEEIIKIIDINKRRKQILSNDKTKKFYVSPNTRAMQEEARWKQTLINEQQRRKKALLKIHKFVGCVSAFFVMAGIPTILAFIF